MNLLVGEGSTWSIRAWMALSLVDIEFDETVVSLSRDNYKDILRKYSESMLVPVLSDGELKIHDSFAIAEYANEISSGKLYPLDKNKRALCKSLCAELHSGFISIRTQCPYYFEKQVLGSTSKELELEITRLDNIFSAAEGNFYFGVPSLVDVFYSVMAHRLANYEIALSDKAESYQKNLLSWDLFQKALSHAKTVWPQLSLMH